MRPLTHAQAALAVQNLCIGSLLNQEELRNELAPLVRRPRLGTYTLTAEVPGWLVSALDPASKRVAVTLSSFPTRDGFDQLLVITLQCARNQIRMTMALSDPQIKLFIADAMKNETISILLGAENSTARVAMDIPLSFEEPQELSYYLGASQPSPSGVMRLLQLTAAATQLDFLPSLVQGMEVTGIVTIVVASNSNQQLLAARTEMFAPASAKKPKSSVH